MRTDAVSGSVCAEVVPGVQPELQERDALKRVGLATALTDALRKRGVPDPAASLAAELGLLALKIAHTRWADPSNKQELGALARQALHELQAASATLS
ncbi:MAG TPA: hypothetical protein VGM53_09525 [Streptosporangiaceae bacterium]|jgi:hypothetical protein